TDYAGGVKLLENLAERKKLGMVAACNTHIIALARQKPDFREALQKFDVLLPDGMPLVWSMRQKGADLQDRVYGPYFMQEAMRGLPRPWKHFFFGGTETCLRQLSEACRQIQPDVDIVGTFSPPFRKWTEKDETEFAEIIRNSGADFIWVALGGGRQERWIAKNLPRYQKGVFLAVGDAFELLAGRRAFAPDWMQQAGLTWFYRLLQEPRRLLPRYLKFNSLFVYYSFLERFLGEAGKGLGFSREGKQSVAFLGCRGVPARYSGFETLVEELGARLAERGHGVTVYNRSHFYPHRIREYRGMSIAYLPSIQTKSLETITHTLLAVIHAAVRKFDVVYLCGVGNSVLAGILKLAGSRVIVNVDGDDFRRQKWHPFARWWLKQSEKWATQFSDVVIADNQTVVDRYKRDYGFQTTYLSYGTPERSAQTGGETLKRLGLKPGKYVLYAGRLTPENRPDLLIRAYEKVSVDWPCVIVGGAGYEKEYEATLKKIAKKRILLTGPIYGEGYQELSTHCGIFVLPGIVEATRLVLLDQMGFGNVIVYHDCAATREVIGAAGVPFGPVNAESSLASRLNELIAQPAMREKLKAAAWERARSHYNWEKVTDEYEKILEKL
ncbi:MAG: WecB/TagA/CpsF family glycosyltransferase, partial [Verrucomicrobia bacterium]|nr:WecB/TagA/CpsF family glycosyltransferase [Verrucomicrobiota bacterium]